MLMSKSKQLLTPILIKRNNKLYKFLYLTFGQDGSIYLEYPRKNKYEIIGDIDVPFPVRGTKELLLERKNIEYELPKITFHPGKMSIHVNATGKDGHYKTDKKVLNMGDNTIVFPLCQIIIPSNADYLDEYNHNKYFKPLEVEVHNSIGSLNFMFWIHPPDKYIALDDLPLIDKLKEVANTIIPMRFVHSI